MNGGTWNAVTVNLGGAGPQRGEYAKSAHEWIAGALGKYHIVFAQEIHGDDWLKDWRDAKYTVIESPHEQFRARSAILVRSGIAAVPCDGPPVFRTAPYHGSYVAAARVDRPGHGEIVVMSVHASPNRVSEEWTKRWRDCQVDLPPEYRGQLWDSDLVVESVRLVAESARDVPVIAAGDWNEARNWDERHPEDDGSGAAFFKQLGAGGLIDACCPNDSDADPTHGPHGRALRLDHVFATNNVAASVRGFQKPGPESPADHLPVEFTIG